MGCMTSNYDKWLIYTKALPSPESYIKFGFYFLIASCLQRRVWYYSDERPLFPNLYILFIGPPAIGKGNVLKSIEYFLRYHKDTKRPPIATSSGPELQLLFPLGADTVTFEKLLSKVADASRSLLLPNKQIYHHASYGFVLQELSSLFKENAKEVVKFLLNAYDCGQYDYETKQKGQDRIRNLCLNFIAGAQMDFLKAAHKHGIFGEGYSSRTIMLFETARRFDAFHIAEELTTEQLAAKLDLLDWIHKLSNCYGKITYGDDVKEYLEDWYLNVHCPKEARAGEKMQHYLGRKKVALLKIAAAIHFGESLEMEIPLPTFKQAIQELDAVEGNMEVGLALAGKNPLHAAAQKMLGYLRFRKESPLSDIILEFAADLTVEEINLCLKQLELTHQLKSKLKTGKLWYYF